MADVIGSQVFEGGVFGTKVVQRDAGAEPTQLGQDIVVRQSRLRQRTLGDIELERTGLDVPAEGRLPYGAHQLPGGSDLGQGEVDGDDRRGDTFIPPLAHLSARLV